MGGAIALASLGALEVLRAGTTRVDAPSTSADALEQLIRLQHAATALPTFHDRALFTKPSRLDERIADAAREIADSVGRPAATTANAPAGSHSSSVIVVDAQGNVVVGTHTIQTLPWGEGLFVFGVPLSTSAPIAFDDASKAVSRIRLDPLTNTLVLRGGHLRAALAVYGVGLFPGDVQVLDAVIARGLDAEDAVLEPRLGYFQLDAAKLSLDFSKNAIDPRFDPKILCAVKKRGLTLERAMPGLPPGFVDTGFPTLVTRVDGNLHGMTPERLNGLAAGD